MSPSELRATLLADLSVNWHHRGLQKSPRKIFDIVRCLGDVRFLPVVLIRLTSFAFHRKSLVGAVAYKACSLGNRLVFGVECAAQTEIGPGLYFPHTGGIVIGAARIGARCTIYHQVTFGAKGIDMPFTISLRPTIGDDVVIAAGAKVLGGVTIQDGAIVAANAVVVHDVPGLSVVGGVPATEIRRGSR